jgi:hypothetical protein
MRHFSCDLCGKALTPGTGPRMVLKIEAYPATDDADLTDENATTDVVDEVANLLEEAEEAGEPVPVPATRKVAYDLCVSCHRRYMANPLGRVRPVDLRFSGN